MLCLEFFARQKIQYKDRCCSIPSQIGGWLLIWGATSLHHLYIARAITGVGIGAGVPIASIYMRWVERLKHIHKYTTLHHGKNHE